MKRILIFSDTHGNIDGCLNIIKNTPDVSAILHAGDCVRDAEGIEAAFPSIKTYYVKGNNDFFTRAPASMLIPTAGKRIYLTHGHEQRVKYEYQYTTLAERGEAANADLIVFGHTHEPYTGYKGKMILLNPGSALFTRTYAVAEIDGDTLKTAILNM